MITSNKRKELIVALAEKAYREAFVSAEINTTLPFQIRATREERGWTQGELAERTGQDQRTISQFESPNYGKLTLTSLKRLAAAFDIALVVRFVPFSELVDWTTHMSKGCMAIPAFDKNEGLADDTSDRSTPQSFIASGATAASDIVSSVSTGELLTHASLPRKMLKVETASGTSGPIAGTATSALVLVKVKKPA